MTFSVAKMMRVNGFALGERSARELGKISIRCELSSSLGTTLAGIDIGSGLYGGDAATGSNRRKLLRPTSPDTPKGSFRLEKSDIANREAQQSNAKPETIEEF
jgi:hypothetical protein